MPLFGKSFKLSKLKVTKSNGRRNHREKVFSYNVRGFVNLTIGYMCTAQGILLSNFCTESGVRRQIEAIDIIPRYGGKIIHDCWASYWFCRKYL
jgi:hypothetical protein